MAAQSARDRKKLKMLDLEGEVVRSSTEREELLQRNSYLEERVSQLKLENESLRIRLEEATGQQVERSPLMMIDPFAQEIQRPKYFNLLDDSEADDEILYDVSMTDAMSDSASSTQKEYQADFSDCDSGCDGLGSSPARSVGSPFAAPLSSSSSLTSTHALRCASSDTSSTQLGAHTASIDDTFESAELINEPQQKDQVFPVVVVVRPPKLVDGVANKCQSKNSSDLWIVKEEQEEEQERQLKEDNSSFQNSLLERSIQSRSTVITSTFNSQPLNLSTTFSTPKPKSYSVVSQKNCSKPKSKNVPATTTAPTQRTSTTLRGRLMNYLILLFSLMVNQQQFSETQQVDKGKMKLDQKLDSWIKQSLEILPTTLLKQMAVIPTPQLNSSSPRSSRAHQLGTMLDLVRKRVRLRPARTRTQQ